MNGGYSASVRLVLHANGREMSPSQVGGGRMYFDAPVSLPAGPAELVIEVDGSPRRKAVLIRASAQPSRVIEYTAI